MSQYLKLTDKLHCRDHGEIKEYLFWCPGCDEAHRYIVGPQAARATDLRPSWQFSGDLERPSFTPSLLYPEKTPRCHLFLTDGQLRYCDDCGHSLAGKTVELPDFEEHRKG